MGKNILVIGFLILLGLSLHVFFSKDNRSIRELIKDTTRDPRVVVEEFAIFKYENHRMVGTLSGDISHFIEPNMVEMYGNIRGLRSNAGKSEKVSADSATLYFNSRGISQLMNDSSIFKADLENNVRLGISTQTMYTEFAEYLGNEKKVRSDVAVKIVAPEGEFLGRRGFEYQLVDEFLTIFGPMRGVLQSGEIGK